MEQADKLALVASTAWNVIYKLAIFVAAIVIAMKLARRYIQKPEAAGGRNSPQLTPANAPSDVRSRLEAFAADALGGSCEAEYREEACFFRGGSDMCLAIWREERAPDWNELPKLLCALKSAGVENITVDERGVRARGLMGLDGEYWLSLYGEAGGKK